MLYVFRPFRKRNSKSFPYFDNTISQTFHTLFALILLTITKLFNGTISITVNKLTHDNMDVVIDNVQNNVNVNLYIALPVQVMWIFGDQLREFNHVDSIVDLAHFDLTLVKFNSIKAPIATRLKCIYNEKW